MAILVTINQTGKTAGVAGRAREDLDLASAVTLSASGGIGPYVWTLIDKPTNATVTVESASTLATSTGASTAITPDYAGTYCGTVSDGSTTTDWAFYAGPALGDLADGEYYPRRVPAFAENLAHNAADAINPTGNTKGWSREWRRWFALIEYLFNRKLVIQDGPTVVDPEVTTIAFEGLSVSSLSPGRVLVVGSGGSSSYVTTYASVDLTAEQSAIIDVKPADPAGINRWKLLSIDLRVTDAIDVLEGPGTPSAVVSIGSTEGGQEIVTNQTVDTTMPVGTIVGGLQLSTLGTDMSQATGFEAIYPAGQTIYATVTPSSDPAPDVGSLTVYMVWQLLPDWSGGGGS